MARFTADDIRRARQADLASYLRAKGYDLRREGNQMRVLGNGNLVINGFKWFSFLTGQGGNAVDFLAKVLGTPFPEAVTQLLEITEYSAEAQPHMKDNQYCDSCGQIREFSLPRHGKNNNAVERYLAKRRGLPENLVKRVIDEGLLYEDERQNAVFVCRDKIGTARAALLRGTDPRHRFIGMAPGSDSNFGWHLPPVHTRLAEAVVVTESPVDALSLLALKPQFRHFHSFSLNGLRTKALDTFLADRTKMRLVFLGLDSDDPGTKQAAATRQCLGNRGYTVTLLGVPGGAKDWNDAVTANRREEMR